MRFRLLVQGKVKVNGEEIKNTISQTFLQYLSSFILGQTYFPLYYAIVVLPTSQVQQANVTNVAFKFVTVGTPIISITVQSFFSNVNATVTGFQLLLYLANGNLIPVSSVQIPQQYYTQLAVEWTLTISAIPTSQFVINQQGVQAIMANALIPNAQLLYNLTITFNENSFQLPSYLQQVKFSTGGSQGVVTMSSQCLLTASPTSPTIVNVVLDGNQIGSFQLNLVNVQPNSLVNISMEMVISGD